MIRELQKKYIRTSMLAVTLLIAGFLIVVNLSNYLVSEKEMRRSLRIVLSDSGPLSHEGIPGDGPGGISGKEDEPPELPRDIKALPDEELAGENYFSFRVGSDGEIFEQDLDHISAISESEAKAYLERAVETGKSGGTLDGYRFSISRDLHEGGYAAAFLDGRKQKRNLVRVISLTLLTGAACWVLMLLLIITMSRKAIRPVAQNIERQKRFITDAGHELKTPLAIISANADVLELHYGNNKWIGNIRSQTERLGSLTQNLLTLARMDEGKDSDIPAVDFDAGEALLSALGTFREAAEMRSISLRTRITEGIVIHARKDAFLRLSAILFENAVKYAKEGGFIEASLEKSGKYAVICIKNDCETLPEGDLSKLFERFYRADSSRNRSTGGSGIGLSVAQAIVEQENAEISVSGETGNVIAFTVRYRLKRP